MKLDEKHIYITKLPTALRYGLVLGLIGLVLSIVAVVTQKDQFYFSFLVAGLFWLSILLGALFYIMIHHLVGARWSIVIRRISETFAKTIPYLGLIFVVVLFFGLESLYHWTHQDPTDHLLAHKQAYLNVPFFMIRAFVFVGVWSLLAMFLHKHSVLEDQKYQVADNQKMKSLSAPGIILFALTITFASFDWIMSLDHHWYSTIFGVYFFSGAVMSFFAFSILICRALQSGGYLKGIITVEHYHDMGKLMFAFMCFWAFIAFSQYMLIWYGNIPEETIWYAHRWEGNWKVWSLFLIIGHFPIPFVLLMSRLAKRNLTFLSILAVWLLFMQWVDLYWLVMPNFSHHGFHLSWIDFAAWLMLGGFTLHFIVRKLKKHALVPIKDPFLQNSIEFMNH